MRSGSVTVLTVASLLPASAKIAERSLRSGAPSTAAARAAEYAAGVPGDLYDDDEVVQRYSAPWHDVELPAHWKRWQVGTGTSSWHGRCLLCDPAETGSPVRGNLEFQVLERLSIHECVADRGERVRARLMRALGIGVAAAIAAVFLYFFIDWDGSDSCPPGEEVIDVRYGDGQGPDRTVCG